MLLLHTIFTKIQCLVAMAQLVEALHYKLEGHGFNYQRCHWDFYRFSPSACTMALGSNQPLNRYEYWKYMLGGRGDQCIGLTTLPPLCNKCTGILGASTSWSPKALPKPIMGQFYSAQVEEVMVF